MSAKNHDNFDPLQDRHDLDLSDLSQPVKAPDLTRAVMGRLGYMHVPRKIARRHRLMRLGRRAGVTLVVLLAMAIGVQMHEHSGNARHRLDVTVPSAVGNVIEHQQRRFNDVIQTIRRITPRTGIITPAETPIEDSEGAPLHDDVIRADNFPTRWV